MLLDHLLSYSAGFNGANNIWPTVLEVEMSYPWRVAKEPFLLPDTHTHLWKHTLWLYSKSVLCACLSEATLTVAGEEEEKENLMHLTLNMSRYVLGFLFDLSHRRSFTNVLYSLSFSWGKWYLQTSHGFWFNLSWVWGLPQTTKPECLTLFWLFVLENQFIWLFFWLKYLFCCI